MCLMKIAFDYVPCAEIHKRRLFMAAATMFMVIGSFLFGLVTVQSIMDDVSKDSSSSSNTTSIHSCVN